MHNPSSFYRFLLLDILFQGYRERNPVHNGFRETITTIKLPREINNPFLDFLWLLYDFPSHTGFSDEVDSLPSIDHLVEELSILIFNPYDSIFNSTISLPQSSRSNSHNFFTATHQALL